MRNKRYCADCTATRGLLPTGSDNPTERTSSRIHRNTDLSSPRRHFDMLPRKMFSNRRSIVTRKGSSRDYTGLDKSVSPATSDLKPRSPVVAERQNTRTTTMWQPIDDSLPDRAISRLHNSKRSTLVLGIETLLSSFAK